MAPALQDTFDVYCGVSSTLVCPRTAAVGGEVFAVAASAQIGFAGLGVLYLDLNAVILGIFQRFFLAIELQAHLALGVGG